MIDQVVSAVLRQGWRVRDMIRRGSRGEAAAEVVGFREAEILPDDVETPDIPEITYHRLDEPPAGIRLSRVLPKVSTAEQDARDMTLRAEEYRMAALIAQTSASQGHLGKLPRRA